MDVNNNYKVLIIQRILPGYRVPFFTLLQQNLVSKNVSLQVVYGQEKPGTVPVTVNVNQNWAHKIINKYLNLLKYELVWQPVPGKLFADVDLVIIEQSNRLLINYYFLLIRWFTRIKVAFWGHGKNMQSHNATSMTEKFKKLLICKVDWWFAYTELSFSIIKNSNFPVDKISNVQNAIDNSSFEKSLLQVDLIQISAIKNELGIVGDNVLLYCGGMYQEKKIDFLVQACNELKKRVPEVHVIFIGDGPEQYKIERLAENSNWCHYVGPQFGSDRAPYFKLSKATLMPGAVGLSMVDSFIACTPLITCDLSTHGPEISYLENGKNGVMTHPTIDDYVEQLYMFLLSEDLQKKLRKGCQESAKKYTLDHMVSNFSEGILKCLRY